MEDDTELLYTPVSFLDSTINLLLDIYYKLYSLNYKSIIAESIQKILDAPFIDKPKLINLDKLYLELVIYSIKTLKNTCDYSKEICGKIIEQNIDNIFIYEDINEFLNIEGSIIKKQCYKILLDKLLNYKFNV